MFYSFLSNLSILYLDLDIQKLSDHPWYSFLLLAYSFDSIFL